MGTTQKNGTQMRVCSGLPDDYFPSTNINSNNFWGQFLTKTWKLKNKLKNQLIDLSQWKRLSTLSQIFCYSIFFILLPLTTIQLLFERVFVGKSLKDCITYNSWQICMIWLTSKQICRKKSAWRCISQPNPQWGVSR